MLYNELLFDKKVELDEVIEEISKLKLDDVINISKRIIPTNIYILGGKTND